MMTFVRSAGLHFCLPHPGRISVFLNIDKPSLRSSLTSPTVCAFVSWMTGKLFRQSLAGVKTGQRRTGQYEQDV
jgi:hypothetical protein